MRPGLIACALGPSIVCVFITAGPVCVFITVVPNTKMCAWGEEDSGGHVLWDTMNRDLCGLV
jgi:hypothetical protein